MNIMQMSELVRKSGANAGLMRGELIGWACQSQAMARAMFRR